MRLTGLEAYLGLYHTTKRFIYYRKSVLHRFKRTFHARLTLSPMGDFHDP